MEKEVADDKLVMTKRLQQFPLTDIVLFMTRNNSSTNKMSVLLYSTQMSLNSTGVTQYVRRYCIAS